MNNSFDKSVKEALEQFNPPYNESLFQKIQQNSSPQPKTKFSIKAILGGTAILAASAVGFYLTSNSTTEPQKVEIQTANKEVNTPQAEQEVSVNSILGGPKTSMQASEQTSTEPQEVAQTQIQTSTNNSSEVTSVASNQAAPKPANQNAAPSATGENEGNLFTPSNPNAVSNLVLPKLKETYCQNEPLHSSVKEFYSKNNNEFVAYTTAQTGTAEVFVKTNNRYLSAGLVTVLEVPNVDAFIEIITDQDNAHEPPFTNIRLNNTLEYSITKASLNNAPFSYPTKKPLHLKPNHSYAFEFTVENENQCTATKTISYLANYPKYNLLAPAAFSPNGDGLNDEWFLPALELRTVSNVSWQVKNMEGVVVFESTSAFDKWNGETPMGVAKPGALYVWQCKLVNEWNEIETYSGTITIR